MNYNSLEDILPPLFATWIEDVLKEPIDRENQSDCNNCPMCNNNETPSVFNIQFNPSTRCCSFIPTIPNYSVGHILSDTAATAQVGKSVILSKIDARTAVTPLGIGPSNKQSRTYENLLKAKEFGIGEQYACPYLVKEEQICSIWSHRISTCSTWFCKHNRGKIGLDFWDALRALLDEVQKILSYWCLLEMEIGEDALALLAPIRPKKYANKTANPLDKLAQTPVPEGIYTQAWGNFRGNEQEFYIKCGALVEDLSWSDILQIGGPELKMATYRLLKAHQILNSKELPEYVEIGKHTTVNSTPSAIAIAGYSPYCTYEFPVEINMGLVMATMEIVGPQRLKDLIAKIQQQCQIHVDTDMQWALIESGVLLPTGAPAPK
ncbi:hypothetical protein [Kaarinaea lacus]